MASPLTSSRSGTISRLESALRSSLEEWTSGSSSSHPSFPSVVETVTQFWTTVGTPLDLDTTDGGVKDGVQQVLLRVIKDDALSAADVEVETAKEELPALYESIKLKLDYSLALSLIGKLEEKAPYFILEDVLAYLTVPGCREVFSFLEQRSTELKLPLPFAQEKTTGLALLRACNVLLSRLSKSQDSVFCGRILSFTSSAFSLGARSGVNLRGDFNVGNETFFEDDAVEPPAVEAEEEKPVEGDVEMKDAKEETTAEEGEEQEEEEEGAVKEESEEGETNEDAPPVLKKDDKPVVEKKEDAPSPVTTESFYKTFWSLQAFFANPVLLSTPPTPSSQPSSSTSTSSSAPFSDFKLRVDRVIATLRAETEKEKALRGTGDGGASSGGAGKGKERDVVGGLDTVFMPKFLTSPGLLAFELADVSFRRQILVQFLILFQHLQALYSPGGPGKVSKTRLPVITLDKEKEKWFESTWGTILEELRSTHPEGEKFTDTVLSILRREQNWTRWKDLNCLAFDLPPIPDATLIAAREKRRRLESAPPPPLANSVGTLALSRLWEKHNLTDLSQLEGKRPMDELHVYSTKLARADLLASNRKRTYEKANGPDSLPANDEQLQRSEDLKSSLTFRALRQASRTSITLFHKFKSSTPRQNYLSVLLEAEREAKEAAREAVERAAHVVEEPEPAGEVVGEGEGKVVEETGDAVIAAVEGENGKVTKEEEDAGPTVAEGEGEGKAEEVAETNVTEKKAVGVEEETVAAVVADVEMA